MGEEVGAMNRTDYDCRRVTPEAFLLGGFCGLLRISQETPSPLFSNLRAIADGYSTDYQGYKSSESADDYEQEGEAFLLFASSQDIYPFTD